MAKAPTSPQLQAGDLFGFPGVTRWTEQQDTNSSLTTNLSLNQSQPVTGILPFKTTDIVFKWDYYMDVTNFYGVAGTTNTTSAYAPYNLLGAFKLAISNLYDVIDVQSGIDLALYNLYRPYNRDSINNLLYTTPDAIPYGHQENNLVAFPVNSTLGQPPAALTFPTTASSLQIHYEIPVSLWFDEYFELNQQAQTVMVANRVPVSPLYMSGTARNVTPDITINAVSGGNTDTGPFYESGGTPSLTGGTIAHRFMRTGMYGTTNPVSMPLVYNWRLALVSKRYSLSGVSIADIPLKSVINNGGGGQVLSIMVRFYDPAVANGGAPISLGSITTGSAPNYNVTKGQLQYGSSLIRFDDTPTTMQRRVMRQHNLLLTQGVWLWDLAIDDNGKRTNARALNAYSTDINLHFEFGTTLSSSAYAVVFVEYLTFIIDQPVV